MTVLNKNIQLPGLGSYMAGAIIKGDTWGCVLAIIAMITLILASDQLIWRPLLAWADKFKIQLTESTDQPTSWFLNFVRRSWVIAWVYEKVTHFIEDCFYNLSRLLNPEQPQKNSPATKRSSALSVPSILQAITVFCCIFMGLWIGYYAVHLGYELADTGRAAFQRDESSAIDHGSLALDSLVEVCLLSLISACLLPPLRPILPAAGYTLFLAAGGYLCYQLFAAILDVYDNVPIREILWIFYLAFLTFLRVATMTVVATLIWTPVGVWIGSSPKAANVFQPIAQILASFPVNMTFPFVIGLFSFFHISIDFGSIFLIAMGTQWYILFNVIAGAMSIPNDLKEAGRTFGLKGFDLWRKLIIPAIFPFWVTGACTAVGGAWNASIVAEVVKFGGQTLTADGLGAYIAQVTNSGDTARTICSIGIMSLVVVTFNKLLWRRLYDLAERRYKLD
jgi:ABC-type anion transport system duplicated permease subunit